MELSEKHYERIEHCFPKHRGSLKYSNLKALNAMLYIAENGAKWRKLPEKYGNWHTIYTRLRRWTRSGVLARVFEVLQQEQLIQLKVEVCSLDSTSVKVHPDGCRGFKKTDRSPLGAPGEDSHPRFIWWPQMSERPSVSRSQPEKQAMPRRGARS